MVYCAAGADLAKHVLFFGEPFGWHDESDRLADGLRGGVTEHSLGRQIPRGDDPVEILADDSVVREFDNRREVARRSVHKAVDDGMTDCSALYGWAVIWRANCCRNCGRFRNALYRRVDARRAVFGDR